MSLQPHLQGNPQVDAEARQTLQERVLTSLIDSRLVEQQLRKEGPDVSAQEVETVVEQIKGQSAAQGSSLDQVLQSTGLSEKDFEKRIEGSLAWQKYQRQAITEPSLQEYYEQNQGQFGEQPFEQVRPQVAQSYASGLWKSLADKARPDAKIEVVAPPGQVRQPPSPADRPVILDSPSQPIDESRSGR